HTLEHLDALAGALHDLDVDLDRVAAAQRRNLRLLLLPFEQVDDVHRDPPGRGVAPDVAALRARSGRSRSLLCSVCCRRQRAIAAWSPLRSTSGTSRPSKDAGRV